MLIETIVAVASAAVMGSAARERVQRVFRAFERRTPIARDVTHDIEREWSFGARLADRVAAVGGSWRFVIAFGVFLAVWTLLNVLLLPGTVRFDPYPFIFLNLLLSMLAAIQAPIIMMSQNRQSTKDRAAAQHDYEVNLKAELEIMSLHEKLDQVRTDQLSVLIQKQEEQIKLLSQLLQGRA